MAEKAQNKDGKKPGFFERAGKSFREMKGEMKKVVWPTKKQVLNNTSVVLVVVIISSVAISVLDLVLNVLRNFLMGA